MKDLSILEASSPHNIHVVKESRILMTLFWETSPWRIPFSYIYWARSCQQIICCPHRVLVLGAISCNFVPQTVPETQNLMPVCVIIGPYW